MRLEERGSTEVCHTGKQGDTEVWCLKEHGKVAQRCDTQKSNVARRCIDWNSKLERSKMIERAWYGDAEVRYSKNQCSTEVLLQKEWGSTQALHRCCTSVLPCDVTLLSCLSVTLLSCLTRQHRNVILWGKTEVWSHSKVAQSVMTETALERGTECADWKSMVAHRCNEWKSKVAHRCNDWKSMVA